MKIKKDFLNDLIDSMSKDYIVDLYEPRYVTPKGVKSPDFYVDNTINLYFEYRKTLNPNFFNKVKNVFIQIVNNDKIIELDNKIILKELYKIMYLIDYSTQLIDFISQKNYPKKYFASIHSDNREINREKKRHKSMIVNARTPLTYKGEHRLNWWFNNLFSKNQKIVKFYLHLFVLVDLEKCTLLKNQKEEIQSQIMNFLESKLIQRTTKKDILKSLAILIHKELRHFLKLQDMKAKAFTSEILANLFDYTPNDEEFNKTIYLRSSIKFLPIFGAKDTPHYTNNEKEFIKKTIFKELSLRDKINFNHKEFNLIFEDYMKNPHIQFLHKYPVEFFRKNPKYSSI